jgi:hypothetical protein
MTRGTRRFLMGSSLVVAVGLATGLVAYYNGNLTFARASAGPAELAYLPPETTGVAFAEVRTIMASGFVQKIRSLIPSDELGTAKTELQQMIGVDIEHDIDTVCAGMLGDPSGNKGGIVMIRGRFNETNIEALITQHGGKMETYKGKRLFTHPEFAGLGEALATRGEGLNMTAEKPVGTIAFLEPGLVAMGDLVTMKKGIDSFADRKNVTSNNELMSFVLEAERTGNAWSVGRFDTVASSPEIPTEVVKSLPPLKWVSASAKFDAGVSGAIRADAMDDKSAEDLRAVVNGGLAAARMMGGQEPQVASMLNALQVTGTGKTVNIAFNITPELIDKLIAMAKGGGAGRPSPIGR